MPRKCLVCSHKEREAIEAALVRDLPLREISALFCVSEDALARHRDTHLPQTLIWSEQAIQIARADRLLEDLKMIHQATLDILSRNYKAGEDRTALAAIREARGNLELIGRLIGELREENVANMVVVTSPEWLRLRNLVLRALEPYPQAQQAVVEALHGTNR